MSAELPAATPPSSRLHGINAAAVIATIKARAETWRHRPGEHDGRKIALVIEGGAMRSIYSAGATLGLAQLGYAQLFDAVYAMSAGAMNASYFLSDQPLLGISVYYDSCVSRHFLNWMRVWKILDVDYLFERIVAVDKPLDAAKVLASRTQFFVAVLECATGRGMLVDTKTTATPLVDVLKATTAMPVLYNQSVLVNGRACVDGGIAIPFPLQQAIDDGCTDILVFLTRPASFLATPPSALERWLFNVRFARGSAALNSTYANYATTANAARELALGRRSAPSGVNIATLCTEPSDQVSRTSSDRHALRAAAVLYARKVLRIFGGDESWDLPPLGA